MVISVLGRGLKGCWALKYCIYHHPAAYSAFWSCKYPVPFSSPTKLCISLIFHGHMLCKRLLIHCFNFAGRHFPWPLLLDCKAKGGKTCNLQDYESVTPPLFCLLQFSPCYYFFIHSLVEVSGTLSMWMMPLPSVGTTQSAHCRDTADHRSFFRGEVLCLLHQSAYGFAKATCLQQHRQHAEPQSYKSTG